MPPTARGWWISPAGRCRCSTGASSRSTRRCARAAGLFDVSHMGEVDVRGPERPPSQPGDQRRRPPVSRAGALFADVLPDGGVVDDLLVYMRGPEHYLLCINAGNIDKDLAWMRGAGGGIQGADRRPVRRYALLAVQGPRAAAIVQSLTEAKLDLVKYYHFTEGAVAGVPASSAAPATPARTASSFTMPRARPRAWPRRCLRRGRRTAWSSPAWARATACAWRRVTRSTATRSRRRFRPSPPVWAGR